MNLGEMEKQINELKERLKENEETIVLNTSREILKPYCPIRVADLDQIEVNNKKIDELKEEVKILGNVEDSQWSEMYNIRKVLRELFQKIIDAINKDTGMGILALELEKILLEKLDSKPKQIQKKVTVKIKKEKLKNPYLDLGMITSKDGELSDYNPSQFIRDYAKTHTLFSLYGLVFPEEDSEGEKEEEISVVADENSPQIIPKDPDHLDSKLPEPMDCRECKYYSLSDRSMVCIECMKDGYSKFKPKEKLPEPNIPIKENGGDVLFYDPCCTCKFEPADNQDLCSKNCFVKTDGHRSAWEPKEKHPKYVCTLKEQEQCDEEGSMDCLKGNSEGEYNNLGVCIHGKKELEYLPKEKPEPTRSSKLLEKLDDKGVEMETVLQTEPELINTPEPLYPKVVYQLGSDSKEYIELKKKYDKLIDEFILKLNNFYARHIIHHKRDSEIFKDFCELIGEYEGMLKE